MYWWRRYLGADSPYAHWIIAAGVFVLLAGGTVWLWNHEVARHVKDVETDLAMVAPVAAEKLRDRIREDVKLLDRTRRTISSGTITTAQQFQKFTNSNRILEIFPIVVWTASDGTVKAVAANEGESVDPVMDGSISQFPGWSDAYEKSRSAEGERKPRTVAIVAGQSVDNVPEQWICMGLRSAEQNPSPIEGAVLALARFGEQTGALLGQEHWKQFAFRVTDEHDQVILGRKSSSGSFETMRPVQVLNSQWQMYVSPTEQFIAARGSRAPLIVLLGGLTAATLAALGTYQALLQRRRERTRSAGHLAALAALAKMSENITENPSEVAHLLAQMAEVAGSLTEMPMRCVGLLDAETQSLHIVHRQGFSTTDDRTVFCLEETPLSRLCMTSAQVLMNPDVEKDPPASISLLRSSGIRSVIVLPLLVSGKASGVILLGSPRPRKFSALDYRLAELWVVEAAAILSNRRLYERLEGAVWTLRRLLDQRDMLYHVNAEIERAGSLHEALERVAELAPRAVDVDACVVCLAHPKPPCIHVIAVTPTDPAHSMPVDAVVECSVCASVIESGQVKIVPDTAEMPVRGFPDMGSVLFVPLRAGAVTNGLLVMLRKKRGDFDPELVRTAELFAARTASAIEAAHLHERTRRQAETNAVLLRELNHRVGNNLASILGLLSMGSSQLPPQSRHWLDRAIERVAMMARAHEMFSGGVQSVGLSDLLRTTLNSISAVKGPDVHISVDLETPDLPLPSGCAITLAMVLHELAYNAVVHALHGGGELIVRGRRVTAQRIALHVIDRSAAAAENHTRPARLGSNDGNGNGNDGSTGHRGVGLQLVQNLVSRELRGSFNLSSAPDGGTIATVELPIGGEPEARNS